MKKAIIFCLVVLLVLSTSMVFAAKPTNEPPVVPAKVKVIGQSTTQSGICLTVIDLSNNEVVILSYSGTFLNLYEVKRTGMFVDPGEKSN